MAVADYIPDKKYLIGAVAGAVVVGGIAVSLGAFGMGQFVPSKETCDKYFENYNGRFVCIISGKVDTATATVKKGPTKQRVQKQQLKQVPLYTPRFKPY